MGGDGGIATSGGMCTTCNCNANGVSQDGAPGTAEVPGSGIGTSGVMCTTSNCNANGVSENGAPGTRLNRGTWLKTKANLAEGRSTTESVAYSTAK
jgi:hypothetical protein